VIMTLKTVYGLYVDEHGDEYLLPVDEKEINIVEIASNFTANAEKAGIA
jgi:hypothetical protein